MPVQISKSEYEARGREVQKLMDEKELNGLVVYFNEYYRENGRYLKGELVMVNVSPLYQGYAGTLSRNLVRP